FSFADLEYHVWWKFSIENQTATEATLVFKAKIDKEWHLYSQFTPDGGPISTYFAFEENKNYELVGKVSEPEPHKEYDSTFQVMVYSFADNATFRQKVKLKRSDFIIKGNVSGQVCKTACMQFDTTYIFKIGKAAETSAVETTAKEDTTNALNPAVQVPPLDTPAITTSSIPSEGALEPGCGISEDGSGSTADLSFWGIFIAGMLGGFL